MECEKEELQLYKNSGEYKAYLQNRYGTRKLNDGEEVRITKGTVIKKTQNSYTIGEVQFKKEDQFSEDEIISDILKHYKVEIDLDETSIPEDISNVVRKYVEDCIKNKKVNKAILDLINEGKT